VFYPVTESADFDDEADPLPLAGDPGVFWQGRVADLFLFFRWADAPESICLVQRGPFWARSSGFSTGTPQMSLSG